MGMGGNAGTHGLGALVRVGVVLAQQSQHRRHVTSVQTPLVLLRSTSGNGA